jgi:restriction endonuclease/topoisomerase-like DNA binding C4 zinc finger protein
MANPQLDQFIQALIWKAVLPIILFGGAAILLREFLRWLKRNATGTGRPNRDARPSATRRIFTPSACPPPVRPPAQREAPPPVPPLTLEDITWENFELLAGEIFRRKGFEVEISSGLGADGGKDLTLRRDGEMHLVQCKLLSAENKVSVRAMREFYGLLVAENAKSGIFMTTGLFSRDTREFAEGKSIKLLGCAEIEKLMASVAHPGENLCIIRNWIDDFAAVAHVTDPDCPRCRKPMKLRRGPTGRAFWGCSSFPHCRGKRNARTELVRAYSYQQS